MSSDASSAPSSSSTPQSSAKIAKPAQRPDPTWKETLKSRISITTMISLSAIVLGLAVRSYLQPDTGAWAMNDAPPQAQYIDQKALNVLPNVLPPMQLNATSTFIPPNSTLQSLIDRPFHIYHPSFLSIIGSSPSLTQIAQAPNNNPLFHEAVVWYPPTDDVWFVQNAGAPAAGTGLNKSAVVQKISLGQVGQAVQASAGSRNVSGQVDVQVVNTTVQVVNPNGGTNYKGQIVFLGEGQGSSIPSEIYQVNPVPPYDTKVILNNYYGRQFNSLNDVAVHPKSGELYFTDVTYGYLQDFRPAPGLPNQVYRFNEGTGAVAVVADGFNLPNGVTFSPDGSKAYVADTGANAGFWGWNYTNPATIYSFDVTSSGGFSNRQTFAFVSSGVPDGVHCDTSGNVYAGCGDGVNVWNPDGVLLGKIYIQGGSANFQFAGKGRMVICAETKLYYVQLAAEGADITGLGY